METARNRPKVLAILLSGLVRQIKEHAHFRDDDGLQSIAALIDGVIQELEDMAR